MITQIKKKDIMLALLSGILLVPAFPPFDFYPLAWVALIPLLMALLDKGIKASFVLGMLTGLLYFGGTVYWTFNPMYFFGNIPAIPSFFLVIALCLYLAGYVGIFSMFFSFLSGRSRFPALLLVPVIWVTLEYLRTYAFTGFPWAVLGYSQYKFLTLIQISDITGIYGISFIVAAVNGAIFDVTAYWPKRLSKMPLFERWPMTVGLSALVLVFILSMFYGTWRLKTREDGKQVRASVIQGNFEQEKKWDANFKSEIINTYKELSLKASEESPYIIVWPESSVPFIFDNDNLLSRELIDFQKTLDSYLLFGSVTLKGIKDNKYELANSTILLSPDAEVLSLYDKMHLVPFGEYVPLKSVFPFIGKLVTAIGDFKQGREYTVMNTPSANISSLICYEIIFPGLVRRFARNGADLFVTVTNDAWFGRTSAPYQHFAMAVFRAVENRVPVLRAANTGISGFIDSRGRIISRSGIFERTVLTENLITRSSTRSFYSRYGDLFAFLCIISFVLMIANSGRRH